MKGAFFHEQLEYRLEVSKDGAQQGDSLPCTFTVKNHGNETRSASSLRFDLTYGSSKAVKEKKFDDLEVICPADLSSPWEVGPQQQRSLQWTFRLDKNSPITDKSQTFHFVYGNVPAPLSQLPLTVEPHSDITTILRILETSFQFVVKGQKYSHGWLDAKLKPSTSQRFAAVKELLLGFRFEENALLMRWVFSINKLAATAAKIAVSRGKSQVDQRLEAGRYLAGGFIDHDFLEKSIEEALSTVASNL